MRIFISYGRNDATAFAGQLAKWLRQQNHEPWLDVENGIPVGAPFDLRIEMGITDSDALIAVLSPWSLRPEGFCRNEILFAQSYKKLIIPVRIADVTPPIQVVSLNYIDAATDPDTAFKELPAAIDQVAAGKGMGFRDWGSARPSKVWWADLQQRYFEEELARHGGSFTGREWLFEQVQEWVEAPGSRLLLVTAEPGFGKSAAAAQMSVRLNVRGVHFCSRSIIESCRPDSWLRGLVYQLAAQFSAYREVMEALPVSPDWADPPESLFRTLVADPLRKIRDRLQVDQPWTFIVDGLDESVAEIGFGLADLLADSAARVPDFLRIVVTSRPDRSILARFEVDGIQCRHLDAGGEPNRRDVSAYIKRRLDGLYESGRVPRQAGTTSKLAELADGNFLFARLTLDALGEGDPWTRMDLDDLGALPRKLGGLYHAMFRKRFKDRVAYDSEVLPLLDCLVAASGPLPDDFLRAASGMAPHPTKRGLTALSQFLGGDAGGRRLFHQSLADWLTDPEASADFATSMEEGQNRLARQCWREFEAQPRHLSAYTLAHLPAHLIATHQWDKLETLLTDLSYIEDRIRTGQIFDLIRDYHQVLAALPEAQAEVLELERHEARAARWTQEIVDYARKWNGGEETPPLPEIIPSVEPWSDERLEEECRRIVENPTRLDRLRAFGSFVESECYPLLEFGGWPGFVAQHAFNRPPGDPVRSVVAESIYSLGVPMLLQHWSSEIHYNPKPALLRTLEGHSSTVGSVSVTPDGRRVVSGSDEGTLRVWDLESGRCLRTLEGHSSAGQERERDAGRSPRGVGEYRRDAAGVGPGERTLPAHAGRPQRRRSGA